MNKTKAVTSGYSYKVTVDASVNGVKQAGVIFVAYRTESDGRRIEADGTLKNI